MHTIDTMYWREQSGVAEQCDADDRLLAPWMLLSEKIGFLLNLYSGENLQGSEQLCQTENAFIKLLWKLF